MSSRYTVKAWLWPLDTSKAEVERTAAFLSDAEHERAERISHQPAADQFRVARGRLRELLAAELCTTPNDVELQLGQNGKLELAGRHAGQLSFSLAHTARNDPAMAAFVLSDRRPVGIDIERQRDIDLRIAKKFTASEQASLHGLSPAAAKRKFIQIWTAKEAALKAAGCGFAYGLDAVDVSLGHRTEISWSTRRAPSPGHFAAKSFSFGGGLIGCIAMVTGEPGGEISIDWQSELRPSADWELVDGNAKTLNSR